MPTQSLHSDELNFHDGVAFLSSAQAIVKGTLESEFEVSLIAGERSSMMAPLLDLASSDNADQILNRHGTRIIGTPDSARALSQGLFALRSGRSAVVIVPNRDVEEVLTRYSTEIQSDHEQGGTLCILLEDNSRDFPASCPRLITHRLNIPCLEPTNLSQSKNFIDATLCIARAECGVAAMVVHSTLLQSCDTISMLPNRVAETADAVVARRSRPRLPRSSDAHGVLRLARQLELNQLFSSPSPGEKVPVGFITIGPAHESLNHVIQVLELIGRVPVLQLGLIHPIDEAVVTRLLTRCETVIVLEPRPGIVESAILNIAESLRHRGETPAEIWGRTFPPRASSEGDPVIRSDEDLHPSVLVRRINHVLQTIRPSLRETAYLNPAPPAVGSSETSIESRRFQPNALSALRRIVRETDHWLRESAPLESRDIPQSALMIDGHVPKPTAARVVNVELWDHRRFVRDGIPAVVYAAHMGQPCLFVVYECASEAILGLDRLARGAIPADRSDFVRVETANFNDPSELRQLIREAVLRDEFTIVVVRDGPPPIHDLVAMKHSMIEIDRLGFESRQRFVRSTDDVCAMRQDEVAREVPNYKLPLSASLRSEYSVDPMPSRFGSKLLIRVRPQLEEIEVTRTQPPAYHRGKLHSQRLLTPQLIHGSQSQWRAHIAGYRGQVPGVVASLLCHAGRHMGFHTRAVCNSDLIGAGQYAWSQVLFSRPRSPEKPVTIASMIPFGEADVIFGCDLTETVSAIRPELPLQVASPQKTYAVCNCGTLSSMMNPTQDDSGILNGFESICAVTRPAPRFMSDVALACRQRFHTDRLVDVALVGVAYQLGLIPLSADAIDYALQHLESFGFGRLPEAFEFGRFLTISSKATLAPSHSESERTAERIIRRMSRLISQSWMDGETKAYRFASLAMSGLDAMPGLSESDSGREARRDFVYSVFRCLVWGGNAYAQQYIDITKRVYECDRGDTGRALTRHTILPLAEAMLIRDPFYIASMTTSLEEKRRVRRLMNIKHARGDQSVHRYLTRIDCVLLRRHLRADVVSPAWPAYAVARLSRLVPRRWRGTLRERQFRSYILDTVRRAAENAHHDYGRWNTVMQRLHHYAVENRLRGMAFSELRMLVESTTLKSALNRNEPEIAGALSD